MEVGQLMTKNIQEEPFMAVTFASNSTSLTMKSTVVTRCIVCLFTSLFLLSYAHVFAQTLRGTVVEFGGAQPIMGATVMVYPSKSGGSAIALATNPAGEFAFEQLRAGYYRCEVRAVGYESVLITEIPVVAGKEQVFNLELKPVVAQLPEFTVTTGLPPARRPQQPLGEIPLSRDQTLRFPAMFFDPGRLAAAYPGVSQTDDGTNSMSIRGNSPAALRWRLEGLDIVNPNHLPNAGTLSDAPAAASGGVLLFSAQMLANSALLTGAFPAGYGDAVGGVMDMNLRAGNDRKQEFTVQAGLVGLDVAAEGPLGKHQQGKSSYLVNYRYSTVGLLGQLGVSFGDEQINFQDLSYNLHFTGKKGGKYTFFGLGGKSENIFKHKEDTTEVKYDKERYDIDFKSETGVVGGSGKWQLGAGNWLKTALVYSLQNNDWHKSAVFYPPPYAKDERREERLAASLEWHVALQRHLLSVGTQVSRIFFHANILKVQTPGSVYYAPYNRRLAYTNAQPWLRWDWATHNGRWNTQFGAQFHYNDVYRKIAPAPRGTVTYRVKHKYKIALSAGLYQQDAPWWMQVETLSQTGISTSVPYISSAQAGLRYTWYADLFWKISAEFFHQQTDHIPVQAYNQSSLINTPEYIGDLPLVGRSRVRNNGVEISVERSLQSGWFVLANGTFFDARYQLQGGKWLHSRWDIGHLSNVTFGKEWERDKSATTTRTVGVGVRGVWAGGAREADIDRTASALDQQTVLDESRGYYRQAADYFRVDLRVYWKRSLGRRRNSTFALDIQNLTAQQNLAYHYYDPFTHNVENKYQLGTIPNFSWKMEF